MICKYYLAVKILSGVDSNYVLCVCVCVCVCARARAFFKTKMVFLKQRNKT